MPQRKGLVAPQNTFLDTIATRFDGTHSNFVLGNAQVRDYPIVYCSDGLVELTGYNRSQIMSRCCSCSFLWGEKTTEEARQSILDALHAPSELQIEVYFQKKSGSSFLCLLDIVPIKNDKGQVVLFLVSHKELTTDLHNKNAVGYSPLLSSGNKYGNTARQDKTLGCFRHRNQRQTSHLFKRTGQPPSFLSAGLATTITAAALGTTTFRNNKLLESMHKNQEQFLSNNRFGLSVPLPVGVNNNRKATVVGIPISLRRSSLVNRDPSTKSGNLSDVESGKAQAATLSSDSLASQESASDRDEDDGSSTTYKFQRRRSRAVLYHLSGRYERKSKRRFLFNKFQRITTKNAVPEYKVHDVQASHFVLLHYSLVKIVWDWMILLCTFYIAVMVPYNAAFARLDEEKSTKIMDIIVEILLIIDIILNFATTYVSKSGQVVYQSWAIALNYLRGWFFLDLLAAIPFDIILYVIPRDNTETSNGRENLVHFLKLARLLRLARLFQKIERYSQYSTIVLGLLMCMFFLIAHWFACAWYRLGSWELQSPTSKPYSWLYELSDRMRARSPVNQTLFLTRKEVYVSSLYFTTTSLTSVGFGNVSPNTVGEKLFSIITMLIGALMHAAVFGNVTTLIQRMYARRSAYQTKSQDLKDFTKAHHLPKPLKQRMLEFFQAMWAINRGIDKEAVLQSFPENLRGDIALHLNREILCLPLFKSASPGCRKFLAQMINTRFATPGECLINRGDIIYHIFFICSGSLEILGQGGTVVGLLGKGDIFGYDIDENNTPRSSAYDVKALSYCEFQCIELNQDFKNILEQYPFFREDFVIELSNELTFNIREGYDSMANCEVLPSVTLVGEKESTQEEDQGMPSETCSDRTVVANCSTNVIVSSMTSPPGQETTKHRLLAPLARTADVEDDVFCEGDYQEFPSIGRECNIPDGCGNIQKEGILRSEPNQAHLPPTENREGRIGLLDRQVKASLWARGRFSETTASYPGHPVMELTSNNLRKQSSWSCPELALHHDPPIESRKSRYTDSVLTKDIQNIGNGVQCLPSIEMFMNCIYNEMKLLRFEVKSFTKRLTRLERDIKTQLSTEKPSCDCPHSASILHGCSSKSSSFREKYNIISDSEGLCQGHRRNNSTQTNLHENALVYNRQGDSPTCNTGQSVIRCQCKSLVDQRMVTFQLPEDEGEEMSGKSSSFRAKLRSKSGGDFGLLKGRKCKSSSALIDTGRGSRRLS